MGTTLRLDGDLFIFATSFCQTNLWNPLNVLRLLIKMLLSLPGSHSSSIVAVVQSKSTPKYFSDHTIQVLLSQR